MIEKFTEEELALIKKELGIKQTAGSKKSICSNQYKRIKEMFPHIGHAIYVETHMWNALCEVCDHTLQNYAKTGKSVGWDKNEEKWKRYTSVFKKDKYRQLMDELLDVIEKYKKESDVS